MNGPKLVCTSYEDWTKYCDDGILQSILQSKFKELFDVDCSSEQAQGISYLVVELMQMKERRDDCFELVNSRIMRRFNMKFEDPDIITLLGNKKIYYAAWYHLTNNTTETKETLDRYIDFDLLGMKTPKSTDPSETKTKYKKKFEEFKENNTELIIKN